MTAAAIATGAALAAALLPAAIGCMDARSDKDEPPPVAALADQLAGEHCHYRAEYDRCSAAPLVSLELLLRPRRHTCVWWAARCIEQRGPAAAAAVPALVAALRDGPNDFDTGDGVIAARSAIAGALAAIGDELAFVVLAEALTDSEIGPAVCRALRRLDPGGVRVRAAVAALSEAKLTGYRRDRFQSNPCLDRRR